MTEQLPLIVKQIKKAYPALEVTYIKKEGKVQVHNYKNDEYIEFTLLMKFISFRKFVERNWK